MTSTADVAPVADGTFISLARAAELVGKPPSTVIRWCREAFNSGSGPLARVRIKRMGRPWEIHEGDLREFVAQSIAPQRDSAA